MSLVKSNRMQRAIFMMVGGMTLFNLACIQYLARTGQFGTYLAHSLYCFAPMGNGKVRQCTRIKVMSTSFVPCAGHITYSKIYSDVEFAASHQFEPYLLTLWILFQHVTFRLQNWNAQIQFGHEFSFISSQTTLYTYWKIKSTHPSLAIFQRVPIYHAREYSL